jgi:hypothetical protein
MSRTMVMLLGLSVVASLAGIATWLLRRRSDGRVHRKALMPGPPLAASVASERDGAADETEYEQRAAAERERRHAAADRLQTDPITERLARSDEATA